MLIASGLYQSKLNCSLTAGKKLAAFYVNVNRSIDTEGQGLWKQVVVTQSREHYVTD